MILNTQDTKYLITSLSLDDILEKGIQRDILMRGGRGWMGGGGDGPDMGSLGWFQVDAPTTCWTATIVTRMIPSRMAFLMVYEAVILAHVVSVFDQG